MTTKLTGRRALTGVRAALEASGAFIRDRNPEAFMAACPLHDDANPSLSVTWKPRHSTASGAVLLHCFSCQAPAGEVAAALGLRLADLFDDDAAIERAAPRRAPARRTYAGAAPLPPRITTTARSADHRWRPTRVYTYTTGQAIPIQQVIRQECRCGGEPHKRFQQRYRHGQRWVYRKPRDFTPVLYRAAALPAAAASGRPVWITEGEKDADTLTELGQLATTNAQGAANFAVELAAQFTGLSVIIAADRDLAGYQRALNLHEMLRPLAAELTVVLPAVTAAKADVTDHVEAQRWRPNDPCGGLIPTSVTDLMALHGAAQARAAAGRADIALAEAQAVHHQRGQRAHLARWLAEAAEQIHAVHNQCRELERHHHKHPSAIAMAAKTATTELMESLQRSFGNTDQTIRNTTSLERIA